MSTDRRISISSFLVRLILLPWVVVFCGCNAFVQSGYLIGGPPSPDEMSGQYFNDDATGETDPSRYRNPGDATPMVESISPGFEGRTSAHSNEVMKPAHSKRLMIYSAKFTVATSTVDATIERFLNGVNAIGGYLESRNDEYVVVRIPAESFDQIVGNMPSLGDVLSRSVKNEDVTRKHRDLKLRLEGLAVARQRIIELLKSADKIEDVVTLEERLAELTLQIETAQGEYKTLNEQVVYSRVEVDFKAKSEETVAQRTNKSSPFDWVNRVGAHRLQDGFSHSSVDSQNIQSTVATMFPGSVEAKLPDGFLVVERSRKELKAVTATDARLRIRKLPAPKKGSLEFWSQALVNHLVNNRGYELVQERTVRDRQGRQGRELTFDVVTGGTATRYLTTLVLEQRPFWARHNALEVTEFVAPQGEFEPYVSAFHTSRRWRVIDEKPLQIEPHYADRSMPGDDDLIRGQTQQGQSARVLVSPENTRWME